MTRTRGFISVLSVALLGMTALNASAASIVGSLSFSGDFAPSPDSLNLASATALQFPNGDFGVDGATGSFGGISQGDTGSIADFLFNPFLSSVNLINIAGFSFELEDVTVASQSQFALVLLGNGTVSGAGFDDTAASFAFTGNCIPGFDNCNFSAGLTAVPLPGALLLFGSALAGLGLTRRRIA